MLKSLHSQKKQLLLGSIFALIAVLFWSGNFIIARGLTDVIPPVAMSVYRWSVAFLVLLPFAFRSVLSQWAIYKKHLGYLIFLSLIGVSCFNTFIYIASDTSSAINLALIAIANPIFIIGLERIVYKQPLSLNKINGLFLIVLGVLVLLTKGDIQVLLSFAFSQGDIWMLVAAFLFALYSILLKKKPKDVSILSFQLITFFIGLLLLLPFYFWESAYTVAYSLDFLTISAILYLGVFASVIAFIMWHRAVEKIGAIKTGMLYYFLPIFSAIQANIFLDEYFSLTQLSSFILIVLGVFLANYK